MLALRRFVACLLIALLPLQAAAGVALWSCPHHAAQAGAAQAASLPASHDAAEGGGHDCCPHGPAAPDDRAGPGSAQPPVDLASCSDCPDCLGAMVQVLPSASLVVPAVPAPPRAAPLATPRPQALHTPPERPPRA